MKLTCAFFLLFFVASLVTAQDDLDAQQEAAYATFSRDATAYSTAHPEDVYAAQWAAHLSALQADLVKRAAFEILAPGCGTLSTREREVLSKQGKILSDAGQTSVPALAFLVSDKICDCSFVGQAAEYASKYPASEPLLAALRSRRDDKQFNQNAYWYLGLFRYFAAYGNRDDLTWMEATVSRMGGGTSGEIEARKFIEDLRTRLSRHPTPAPNKALQPTAEAGGVPAEFGPCSRPGGG